jgi:hypothetical protein
MDIEPNLPIERAPSDNIVPHNTEFVELGKALGDAKRVVPEV